MSVALLWTLSGLSLATAVLLAIIHIRFRRLARKKFVALSMMSEELDNEEGTRKKAEEVARIKEEGLRMRDDAYRALMNNTQDLVFSCTVTQEGLPGHFFEVNDAMCDVLGHSREKLLTMTPLDVELAQTPSAVPGFTRTQLVTVSDSELHERRTAFAVRDTQLLVKQILDKGQVVYERTYVNRDGNTLPVEIRSRRVDLFGEPMIMSTVRDQTARVEIERALHDSEQRFQDLFANSPTGMAVYDTQRTLIMANNACMNILGIPDRQAFTKFDFLDNPFLPRSAKRAINSGESTRYEAEIDFDEVRRLSIFVSGKTGTGHYDILVNNLGLNRNFNPKGFLVQVQDVSKRVIAEAALRSSERQLRQAQKMEAIGTLAGGIAHDFNNILTPIMGYTEMTIYACRDKPKIQEYMQEVLKASNRAKELVNQILTFSRRAETEGKPIHITPIVKEVLKLIAATLHPGIEVRRLIKTEHDIVTADPTQIHQVLMNLCTNATHAMQESGGILEVMMTDFMLGTRGKSEFPHLEPGRYLRISVKDTGAGMDAETLERIFEPFFTTKDGGEGTGMGLAVVHGVVTSLKGAITVEAELNQGSIFHVILPTIEQPAARSVQVEEPLPAGHECILFVDDDPGIGRLVSRMLSTLEYETVIMAKAATALEVFRQHPDRFDLVVTDQVMPGMTGIQLAGELRDVRPGIPVILCSGYSEAFSREEADAAGICEFLPKPISMRDLAEAVRRALDRRTGQLETPAPDDKG